MCFVCAGLLALILGTHTCRKHEKYVYDIGASASALESGAGCKDWGGRLAAETLKKKMEAALHSLKDHIDLLHTQRNKCQFHPLVVAFCFPCEVSDLHVNSFVVIRSKTWKMI